MESMGKKPLMFIGSAGGRQDAELLRLLAGLQHDDVISLVAFVTTGPEAEAHAEAAREVCRQLRLKTEIGAGRMDLGTRVGEGPGALKAEQLPIGAGRELLRAALRAAVGRTLRIAATSPFDLAWLISGSPRVFGANVETVALACDVELRPNGWHPVVPGAGADPEELRARGRSPELLAMEQAAAKDVLEALQGSTGAGIEVRIVASGVGAHDVLPGKAVGMHDRWPGRFVALLAAHPQRFRWQVAGSYPNVGVVGVEQPYGASRARPS
jgi:hypothetical protein